MTYPMRQVWRELDCVDRLYLNAYVPTLRCPGRWPDSLHDISALMLPSPAAFEKIGNRFRGADRSGARGHITLSHDPTISFVTR